MEKVRNFIFLGLLVGLFVEVLIVFPLRLGRQPSEPVKVEEGPRPDAGATSRVADQKMEGVHLVESQKGSRDWELFASQAEGRQGEGNWDLKTVRVLFYNLEKVDFTVTGGEGLIDAKTRNMKIRGHVVTTSANGYVFRSEEILYDAKSRTITSPGAVEMLGPGDRDGGGMQVQGKQMVVNVETSVMKIHSDIRANKPLREGRSMKLVSNSAEFSARNKEAKFLGDVVMQYDRVKLEGPEASFLQSSQGNFLSNIRFSGGVKVSDLEKFATSENLNLDLVLNRFVFTGRPKVYQNNDELSGEQIIFLEGGKKVKVERVRARVEKTDP